MPLCPPDIHVDQLLSYAGPSTRHPPNVRLPAPPMDLSTFVRPASLHPHDIHLPAASAHSSSYPSNARPLTRPAPALVLFVIPYAS